MMGRMAPIWVRGSLGQIAWFMSLIACRKCFIRVPILPCHVPYRDSTRGRIAFGGIRASSRHGGGTSNHVGSGQRYGSYWLEDIGG